MTKDMNHKTFKASEAHNNVLQAARGYLRLSGWFANCHSGVTRRAPQLTGWPELRLTKGQAAIASDDNVGLLLRKPSHGLVDIDLDASMAASVAPTFLPQTKWFMGAKASLALIFGT